MFHIAQSLKQLSYQRHWCVCSGGGFIFMSWMFAILKDMAKTRPDAADVLNRIKGIILDSSPAMVNADVSSR